MRGNATGTPDAPITWIFEPESFAPLAKLTASDRYGIVTDHLGTPTAMLDEQGQRVWAAEIGVYGDLRNVVGEKQACPFRWPGQYEDEETGLYYNRFRYYDPEAGGYICEDPIRLEGGLRLRVYPADPLTWVDQLGLVGADCGGDGYAEIAHYPSTDPHDRFGHYSIRVVSGEKSQFSHQVTSRDHSRSTITADPSSRTPDKIVRVQLPDAAKAIEHQKSMLGKPLGPYDLKSNSCVTHVADVLRQGGATVPDGAIGQYRYLTGL